MPKNVTMLQLLFVLSCNSAAAAIDPHDIFTNAAIAQTNRRIWDKTEAAKAGFTNLTAGGLIDTDIELIGKYYSSADSVVEFGVGASTKIATFVNVSRYSGVDSDTRWLKHVATFSPSHFRFHYADIGQTGLWGRPDGNASYMKYPFYSTGVLAVEDAFDFYLIDGRFRMACVVASMLHASRHHKKPEDYLIGIHDFRERHGEAYSLIPEIADHVDGFHHAKPLERDAILGVYRRRSDITDEELVSLWHRFKHIPAR